MFMHLPTLELMSIHRSTVSNEVTFVFKLNPDLAFTLTATQISL